MIEGLSSRNDQMMVSLVFWVPSRPLISRNSGLLGGLWNFPNTPCVEASSSDLQLEDLISGPITEVLHDAPAFSSATISQVKKTSKNSRKPHAGSISTFFKKTISAAVEEDVEVIETEPERGGSVKLVHIEHAPSVLHVFSHVRKTYRPIWVVLEGGSEPPQLAPTPPPASTPSKKVAKKKVKKRKVKQDTDDESDNEPEVLEDNAAERIELKWVKAEDVEHAK